MNQLYMSLCVCCKEHIMKLNDNDSIRWLLNFFLTVNTTFCCSFAKITWNQFCFVYLCASINVIYSLAQSFFSLTLFFFGLTREYGFSYAFLLVYMLTASELRSESQFRRYLRIIVCGPVCDMNWENFEIMSLDTKKQQESFRWATYVDITNYNVAMYF